MPRRVTVDRSGPHPSPTAFARMLSGGDRRAIGQADRVAAEVARHPDRFSALWDCLAHADPLVRMRAADALEKVSRAHPAWFAPHRRALLSRAPDDGTAEVRWHLVAIIGRLTLSNREAADMVRYLDRLAKDDASRIVKVMAIQAVADICARHPELDAEKHRLLVWARSSLWPSVRARARKLADEARAPA